ncbi:hypothetical protein [Nocardia wallacei]|uniref:hypothetical protein n=1 Tax=Nocardia wallacei TaxID=480035 RepID=UPI002454618F|nr:hypothetical protein [Nocardia wallacei]
MEPADEKGGQFRFNPEPKTVIEAKSELLPTILLVAAGPVVVLPDLHRKSAELATQWLCCDNTAMTVAGYYFAVLECDGNCHATYTAFQSMIQESWLNAGRPIGIVTAETYGN